MVSVDNKDLEKMKKITSELSNEYSRKIIFSIVSKAKSGIEIANNAGLSQSTVYQKLTILKNLSLIQVIKKLLKREGI